MTIDPVTLAVVQNGLRAIANEMDLVHQKTSFSPMISEAFDRANGIYHKETGDVIAQGDTGLPTFVGVMQFTTQSVIRLRKDYAPGDVFIINDPYLGGTHLMDVKFVMPFYYEGKLWCFLANSAHWADIGGMVPGGFATSATEIQQEGLRLPPVKLYSNGALNQEIVDILLSNVRVPEERLGDIKAQLAALHVGARSLTRFLDRYGAEEVAMTVAELRRRSEVQMRSYIEAIPDGVYTFTTYLDSDGVDFELLRCQLDLTVKGPDLFFDFSRSSPPCRGPMNSVWAITQSAVYIAIKHIFPDVPINAGCFVPLHIAKPKGTFLYAEYPRPVSGCAAEVSMKIIAAVFGALVQAIPDSVAASPFSTAGNWALGGFDPKRQRRYVMMNFSGGGYGGSAQLDGLTNGPGTIGISKIEPIEILEQQYPVLYEEYSLREDSAGAGHRRGGFGTSYRMRLLRGEANLSFMMEHGRTGPHGVLDGEAAAMSEIEIIRNGKSDRLPHVTKASGLPFDAGDRVQVRTPGGGGYGDPKRRERDRVLADLQRGYISEETARTKYGVDPAIPMAASAE